MVLRFLSEICGQQNVRALARDNTGQNIEKGYTLSLMIEIKISDIDGNRTRDARLEGSNSTDDATATDSYYIMNYYLSSDFMNELNK